MILYIVKINSLCETQSQNIKSMRNKILEMGNQNFGNEKTKISKIKPKYYKS